MLRFLITDDDDVTHAFMRHILLNLGDVTHAFSGYEAVDACARAVAEGRTFDCVFMDILMPGMDGWETLDAIINIHEGAGCACPKVVVATCLSPEECRAGTELTIAAHGYVHKPFDRRTVLAVLAGLGLAQGPVKEKDEDFFW